MTCVPRCLSSGCGWYLSCSKWIYRSAKTIFDWARDSSDSLRVFGFCAVGSHLSGLVGSVNSICTYPARSLLLQTNLDAGDIIASVGLLCLVELR